MSKERFCDRLTGGPFSDYFSPHQSGTITQGTAIPTRIFYGRLPETCRGFLNRMASGWQAGVVMTFKIDGQFVEEFRRVMGLIQQPNIINPPYFIYDRIEVYATNTGTADWDYDVLLDGRIYHDPRPDGI